MTITEMIALPILLFGVFFSVVGVIGIVRLPDVYSRIHASGKVANLGVAALLACASLLAPENTLKSITLVTFIIVTSPVASHAIALAAFRQGVPRAGAVRDDLATREQNTQTSTQEAT